MQDLEHAMEIRDILDRIKTIRSCEHELEVEARYGITRVSGSRCAGSAGTARRFTG